MNAVHQSTPPTRGTGQRPRVGRGPGRIRQLWLSAVVALGAGMFASAAGAGIGFRHLQKTGMTIETVAGLVVLATGLALLGHAAVVAWKVMHGWWRLTLLPMAVVVAQLVLSSAVAVMYAVVPPTALGAGDPADLGLAYRDVAFATSDGAELSAWFIPSRNGAAVVLKHGAGSTRTATLRHADVLARHGYGVLMMDARGHGHSGGTGMDLGWYGDLDTTAAVTFLSRQDGVDRSKIGVVGLSMGGEEAIGAAGADPRIAAVVAEGATGRTAADKSDLRPHDLGSALEQGLDWWTYGLTDLLTRASPPVSLRRSVAAAVDTEFLLLVAGTVEEESLAAASMRSADPRRVQVWTVRGAGHTQGLGTAPEEWERRVVDFLDEELHGETSGLAP